MGQQLQDTKCYKCGVPATHMVQDVQEWVDDDSIFFSYTPTGKARGGCDEHPQKSRTYPSPSRLSSY